MGGAYEVRGGHLAETDGVIAGLQRAYDPHSRWAKASTKSGALVAPHTV